MTLDPRQREHLILLEDYKHIFLENDRGQRILEDLKRNFLYGSKSNPLYNEGDSAWGENTQNDNISLGKRIGHMEIIYHIIETCHIDPIEFFEESDPEEIQSFINTGKDENE